MVTLTEATTPFADRFVVPAGWRQGRGAYGGLCIAAMVRAAEARFPDRAVRSVTAELLAPVDSGEAALAIDVLKHGSSVSAVRVQIVQRDTRAHAVVLLAAARRAPDRWIDLAPPPSPPWREVPAIGEGPWPEFASHFEYRVLHGVPMAGAAGAQTVGWVRPRHPGPARDAAYIAAMIDAWYPAALVRMTAMRPMATLAYTLDIVAGAAGLDPEAPLLYRGVAPICGDGYFLETRELWGEDGRLVAVNQQTFAIIQ